MKVLFMVSYAALLVLTVMCVFAVGGLLVDSFQDLVDWFYRRRDARRWRGAP